ncbi:MAG: ECF transporter S component [Acholeplasmatales bacterium]|nr:ECF transporter S component [Acholeplasmatales bacterium]
MENENKSGKTSKNVYKNLIIFIIIAAISLGLIITAVILNYNLKESFIKTDDVPKYSPGWYIYLMEIGGAILFLLSFGYLYSFLQEKCNFKKITIKQMSVIGIFSALSVILYYFGKFNLPIFPSWLDIQFSDVPILIVSFMYGPISGVLMVFVRFFCKLPGTSTVGVGEFADVLIGLTLCIVAGIIYKKHRSLKGALCAMGIGMLSATVMATVANWLILIPAYKGIAGFPQAALTKTMDTILGAQGLVTDDNFMAYYLFVGVIPFNLVRYVAVFIITFVLYKRLKMFIVHFVGDFDRDFIGNFDKDSNEFSIEE